MSDLRDKFAMAAVQGLLAGDALGFEGAACTYWQGGRLLTDDLSKHAYQVADAMLKVREATTLPKHVPMPSSGRSGSP